MGEARRAPGGKRLATSVTAAVVALMAIPAWALRSGFDARPSPSTRSRPRPARPRVPPPALRVVAFASSDGQGARHDADHIGAASRPGQTPATMSASASPSPPATVPASSEGSDRRRRPRRPRPIPVLLRPQGALRVDAVRRRRGHLDHRPRRRREPLVRRLPRRVHALPLPVGRGVGDAHDGRRRHAWARYPAGGGRWRQTGAERARRRRRGRFPSPPLFHHRARFRGCRGCRPGGPEGAAASGRLPVRRRVALVLAGQRRAGGGHTYSWRFEEDFEKPLVSHLVAALAPLSTRAWRRRFSTTRPAERRRRRDATREPANSNSRRRRAAFRGRGLEPRHVPRRTPSHARALRRVRPGREQCPLTVSLATARPARRTDSSSPDGAGSPRGTRRPVGRRGPRDADGGNGRGETPRSWGRLATCRVLGRVGRATLTSAFVAQLRASSAPPRRRRAGKEHPGMVVRSVSAGAAGSRGGRWMCWCVVARWRRCARRRTRCRPWRRRRETFRS